jgi:hypothetical protein
MSEVGTTHCHFTSLSDNCEIIETQFVAWSDPMQARKTQKSSVKRIWSHRLVSDVAPLSDDHGGATDTLSARC